MFKENSLGTKNCIARIQFLVVELKLNSNILIFNYMKIKLVKGLFKKFFCIFANENGYTRDKKIAIRFRKCALALGNVELISENTNKPYILKYA